MRCSYRRLRRNIGNIVVLALAASGLGGFLHAAFAGNSPLPIPQQTPVSTADKEAAALVEGSYAAYKALRSFSCQMERESSIAAWFGNNEKAPPNVEIYTTQYRIQKPDRVACTRVRQNGVTDKVVLDSKFLCMMTTDPKALPRRHLEIPVSPNPGQDTSIDAVNLIGNWSPVLPWKVMPFVVFGVNYMRVQDFTWKKRESTQINGEPVDVVYWTVEHPASGNPAGVASVYTLTFSIAKSDHLLRQIRAEERYSDGSVSVTTDTFRNVQSNPSFAPELFTFQSAKGSVAVTSGKELYPPTPQINVSPAVSVGAMPPALDVSDLDGRRFALSDYKGKVVLLDFWSTWCGPCVREMPALVATYNKFSKQGLEVVGFALETDKETKGIRAFCRDHKMPWRQVLDLEGKLTNGGFVPEGKGIPYTILLGKNGRVAATGLRGSELETAIQSALREP